MHMMRKAGGGWGGGRRWWGGWWWGEGVGGGWKGEGVCVFLFGTEIGELSDFPASLCSTPGDTTTS